MKKTRRRHGHEAEWKRPAHGQVRVYVWEWPVRFAHWIIFTTIVSLSITGYYMHYPFIIPHGRTAYVMGTMRFIHLLSGFAFIGAILIRVVWMFIGNQWSHWDQFIPTTKKRLKDLSRPAGITDLWSGRRLPTSVTTRWREPPMPSIFGMAFIEILTGLALYSQILGNGVA